MGRNGFLRVRFSSASFRGIAGYMDVFRMNGEFGSSQRVTRGGVAVVFRAGFSGI